MQRHTLIDRQAAPAETPDYLDALKQEVNRASDFNNRSKLARLRNQAIGAYRATGREGFRQLSEYTSDIELYLLRQER